MPVTVFAGHRAHVKCKVSSEKWQSTSEEYLLRYQVLVLEVLESGVQYCSSEYHEAKRKGGEDHIVD